MKTWKKNALALGPAVMAVIAVLIFNPSLLQGDAGWYTALGLGVALGGISAIVYKILD